MEVEQGLLNDPASFIILLLTAIVLLYVIRSFVTEKLLHPRRKQSGFSLIEMLVVMSIMMILAGVALVSAATTQKMVIAQDALKRVQMVRDAEVTYQNCMTAQNPNCGSVLTVIPRGNDCLTRSYSYFFTDNDPANPSPSWSFVAVPSMATNRSYYTDSTGFVRYSDYGYPTKNSPILR